MRADLPTDPFRVSDGALAPHSALDDYEIERVISHGAFAVVYRAFDPGLRLPVAIKEYLPDALALREGPAQVVLRAPAHAECFQQGLQAFLAEARTLARCDHPSLVRILRVLQRNGTAYRVMPYAPGPTLLAHCREVGALPGPAEMESWLDGLLGALEVLHEEGCVHGGVAPGRILLLPGERPMLLDFGAVRAALISGPTQGMIDALEPSFVAPEQTDPQEPSAVGPWSDLYALAMTMRFCIGGEWPAPADGPHGAPAPEPLVEVWSRRFDGRIGAPPWLDALDTCLREDPRERPQSVARFRSLVGRLAASHWPQALPALPASVPAAAEADEDAAPPTLLPLPTPTPTSTPTPTPTPTPDSTPGSTPGSTPTGVLGAGVSSASNVDAAAACPTAPPTSRPEPPRGPWVMGAAAALLLTILFGIGLWLPKQMQIESTAPSDLVAAAQAAAHVPPAAPTAPALQAAPTAPVSQVPQVPQAVPVAARRPAPATDPAPAVTAAPADLPREAAAPPADLPPAKPAVRSPPAPRASCGGRSGLALLQCMQAQCAKRAYARHAQCVRLRTEQKL